MIVAMIGTLLGSTAIAWNFAVAKGKDTQRLEQTQAQHAERITKLETNAELDRRERREEYSQIRNMLFDIQLTMKDKQDRTR